MSLPRVPAALLGVLVTALVVTAIWLAFDNPDIGGTSRGDHYTCLAPWDTVLNSASNYPGGEPPPDGDEIAARCRDAGRTRFELAGASGVAAVALAAFAASRRRSRAGVRLSAGRARVTHEG